MIILEILSCLVIHFKRLKYKNMFCIIYNNQIKVGIIKLKLQIMKSKWNIILIVIIVVILLAILIFGKTDKIDKTEIEEPEIVLPEPTADATSTIDSILKLIENEADILESQEIDSNLIDSEIQEFDDFGNIYNEQEI